MKRVLTRRKELEKQRPFEKVLVDTINPKSVSIGRLYGDFDKITHDWTDGVLATVIKDCAFDKSGNRRWILMDGPVDANWIENLNTVLDDNKKLCLSSGEIVKFTPKMTMMFEVEDLLEASPATVSRCGMVYIDPERMGWEFMLTPWMAALPHALKRDGRGTLIKEILDVFLVELVGFSFGREQSIEEEQRLTSIKPIMPVTKQWIVKTCLNLFESLLLQEDTRESLAKKEEEMRDKEEARKAYEALQGIQRKETMKRKSTFTEEKKLSPEERTEIFSMFLMAATWSFGGALQYEGRKIFSEWLQSKVGALFDQIERQECDMAMGKEMVRRMVLEADKNYFDCMYHT